MRVTVIADDNRVIVDGKGRKVDTSGLLSDKIHAMQWYGDFGEIEFRTTRSFELDHRPPNVKVKEFTRFEPYLNAWNMAKDDDD